MLICTRKQKNGPSSTYQALSIGSCNSCHAQSARTVDPLTSPCPILSASAEPIFKTDCATDNMRLNFDDDYSCHSQLKGQFKEAMESIENVTSFVLILGGSRFQPVLQANQQSLASLNFEHCKPRLSTSDEVFSNILYILCICGHTKLFCVNSLD